MIYYLQYIYYIRWTMGSKRLALNHMVKILLTAKETNGDWNEAFKHIPKRKTMVQREKKFKYSA